MVGRSRLRHGRAEPVSGMVGRRPDSGMAGLQGGSFR